MDMFVKRFERQFFEQIFGTVVFSGTFSRYVSWQHSPTDSFDERFERQFSQHLFSTVVFNDTIS